MKKLLLTGASGFLGWQAAQKLPADWQAIGTFHQSKNSVHPALLPYSIDLTVKDEIWRMLKATKPDAVFHLAAESGTGACEKEPERAHIINVDATAWLAEMCAEKKSKFLFTSSEQVFDGTKGNYAEEDEAAPKNEYGKQKLEAEKRITELGTTAIIVRIAVLFGKGGPGSNSFLEQWVAKWKNQQPVTTFHDEIRPFLSGRSAAAALFHLLKIGAEGLFHLGGADAVSRTEFAEKATGIFGLETAEINSISQKDVETAAFRPPDLSLNLAKIKGAGFVPRSLEEELRFLKNDFRKGAV